MAQRYALRPDDPLYDLLKWMSWKRVLLWLLPAIVCIYFASLNSYWWYQPDSPLYLTLARSLARTGTFAWNFRPHVYVWPGFPAFLSLIYAAIGENFLVLNIVMALFGLCCIPAAGSLYSALGRSNLRAGVCVLTLGFSGMLLYYSQYILTDVPFTLLVILGLYSGLRLTKSKGPQSWKWTAAGAIICCAAVFVRPHGPALLIAILAGLWLREGALKRLADGMWKSFALAFPTVLGTAAWLFRNMLVRTPEAPTYYEVFLPRTQPSGFLLRIIAKAPEMLDGIGNVLAGIDVDALGGTCMLAVALLGMARSLRRREFIPLCFAVIHIGGVFLGSPGRRYLLPVLPLLILWLVDGAFVIGHSLLERCEGLTKTHIRVAGLFALGFLLSWNIGRVTQVIWHARRPNSYARYEEGILKDHVILSTWLDKLPNAPQRVLIHNHRLLHYLAEVEVRSESRRWRALPREYALNVVQRAFDFVILTKGQENHETVSRELIRTHPDLFEKCARFGSLTVYRPRGPTAERDARAPQVMR